MSNTIQIKRSSTAAAVPTAGQLAVGELAVNLTDKKLYTKDQTNAVVLLNPESPPFSINGLTTATPATDDFLPFSDTSDSNTNKKATVQSVVALGLNATGSAPIYACRAWVNFNGTGTVAIRASGNVSSITDNGTGDYTVNFATAMPDANYSAQVTVGFQDTVASDYNNMSKVVQITTTSVRFKTGFYASFEDRSYCGVSIFR